MKAPRHSPTKIRIAQGGPSPHRRQRLIETDRIPIYRQMFPTKHPLRAEPGLIVEPSPQPIDSLPIHRQPFPIPIRSSQDHAWEVMDSDEEEAHLGASPPQGPMTSDPQPGVHFKPSASEDSVRQVPEVPCSKTPSAPALEATTITYFPNPSPTNVSTLGTSPKPTSIAKSGLLPVAKPSSGFQGSGANDTMTIQSAATRSLPSTAQAGPAFSSTGSIPSGSRCSIEGTLNGAQLSRAAVSRALFPQPSYCSDRKDKKIRDLEEYMGWYSSSGNLALEAPSRHDGAQFGDVFVHSYGAEHPQVWMRTASATWERVYPGHDHPYLPGYRLLLKNNRPAWVTRKTIATYHYRR